MKNNEKLIARQLRKDGKSIKEICAAVGVSKTSISNWVRDIELTAEQKMILEERNPIKKFNGFPNYEKLSEIYRERRRQNQEIGRRKAQEGDINHAIGCMLYWGEGTKSKGSFDFTNSDLNMLRQFVLFVKKYWNVKNEDIALGLNCYLDHELSAEQIFNYWIENLDIKGCKINKAVIRDINMSSVTNGKKKSKLKYGVLKIRICNVEIQQQVLGAIQEYCHFSEPKWLY